MKAIVSSKYGPPEVLQLREVKKPTPKSNEVLVTVYATAVNSADCRMRSLDLKGVPRIQRILYRLILGFLKPRRAIQGLYLAGEIEEIGCSVKKFKIGDQIYARTPNMKLGAYAEFACLPENSIMGLKPNNLTYEEAVAIPFGGLTALYFLRKGKLQIESGEKHDCRPEHQTQKVLIYGASGAVGSAAVQLAKYDGAIVTGVCSTENLEWVKSIGADDVVDYTKEDFAKRNEHFDLVFDAVGKLSFQKCKNVLTADGMYLSVAESGHAKMEPEDLTFLTKLVEAGKLKPIIDRCYPFEQMAEAHRYVDKGHKKGNVVITVKQEKKILIQQ